MRHHGTLKDDEASQAAWEAGRGALVGGSRWGLYFAALGAAGYAMSPVYRGLTIQFKFFIQMSGMVFGGMIEADSRLRQYEASKRLQRKMMIDRAAWDRYEKAHEEPSGPTREK